MFKKIILIILAVIFAALIGAFIYVNYVYLPKNLKPMVIKVLESALDKKVNIENAFYFPLKGVLFTQVSINNKDNSPFLEVKKINLAINSFPRISAGEFSARTKLVVEGIVLKQAQIELKGSSFIDANVELKANQLVFKGIISLDNMQVSGLKPMADITQIKGNISVTLDSFSSNDLSAVINKEKLSLILSGKYDKDNVRIENLKASFGKTNVSCTGKVFEFAKPKMEFGFNGSINLGDIKKFLAGIVLPVMDGDCKFSGNVSGGLTDLTTIKAKADLEMGQGILDKLKITGITGTVLVETGVAIANPLKCSLYQGTVNATANAKFLDLSLPMDALADISGINIEPLIKDYLGLDIGAGLFNAHAAINGKAVDLNSLNGSGWFKMTEGRIKSPTNFGVLANVLQVKQLSGMEIKEASANFTIASGKIETQDLLLLSNEATVNGKGYMTFSQYVDAEISVKLAKELVETMGGLNSQFNLAPDGSGLPAITVKVKGPITKLKYEPVLMPMVKEVIKETGKQLLEKGLQGLTGQQQGGSSSGTTDVQKQIKDTLKGLFKK